MSAAENPNVRLINCRGDGCGEPLARVTERGIYPLIGVLVYVEQGRMRLECAHCGKRIWWSLSKAA